MLQLVIYLAHRLKYLWYILDRPCLICRSAQRQTGMTVDSFGKEKDVSWTYNCKKQPASSQAKGKQKSKDIDL